MSAWLWVESLQACVSKIWSPIMRARSREAGSDYNVQLYARGAVSKLEVLRTDATRRVRFAKLSVLLVQKRPDLQPRRGSG